MGTIVRAQKEGFAVMFDTPIVERISPYGQFPENQIEPHRLR
jgi:hypothetical protein